MGKVNIRLVKKEARIIEANKDVLRELEVGKIILGDIDEESWNGDYFYSSFYENIVNDIDNYTKLAIIRMR